MPMREDTGPTVDPSRFRGPGEPYAGHWREFPASWPSLEQQMPAGEMRVQVADALARLPDRKRVVITLRDVEGKTPAEVCSILNISARATATAASCPRLGPGAIGGVLQRDIPHGPDSDPEPT